MDEDIIPEGVTLRDLDDPAALRREVNDSALNQLERSLSSNSYGGLKMAVSDLHYADPEFSLKDEKKALLSGKDLASRLKGTVSLIDEATGQVLDKKTTTLMRVPYVTRRGTWIRGGNEWVTANQARLLPGAYTRFQANGGLETQFNVRTGTGAGFRVRLDPATAQYRLAMAGSNLHLYSVLKDVGVDDAVLEKKWGPDILEANKTKYDKLAVERAYDKLVPARLKPKDGATREDKIRLLKEAWDNAQVHEGVMKRTLPNMFDMEKSAEWQGKWEYVKMASANIARAADNMDFEPDLTPLDVNIHEYKTSYIVKAAKSIEEDGVKGFKPDIDTEEEVEELMQNYGKLAGMKEWPDSWYVPGGDNEKWLDWYFKYMQGTRTNMDDIQKKRWKLFKAREGSKFIKNPTPRRAYSLMNWAIDPMKLLPTKAQRENLKKQMAAYEEAVTKKESK